MVDFKQARKNMVDCQVRPNDVTHYRVIDAFMSVPREAFVSTAQKPFAYSDEDLPVSSAGSRRFLMEPMSLSKLIQLAAIRPDSIVLDIGCATGYSTAIVSLLCDSVVGLECEPELATLAGKTLSDLGYDNAVVVTGPLQDGYAKEAPYDVIFIGGAVETGLETLCEQLKVGGRLVVVEGTGNAGAAKVYIRESSGVSSRFAFNSAVMPLPGFEKTEDFVF